MFYRALFLLLFLPTIVFSYTVVRNDGKSFSGQLIHQSPEATIIQDHEGVKIRFRSHQIDWNRTSAEIRNSEATLLASRRILLQQDYRQPEVPDQNNASQWTGEPFSFDFKDIDIKDLFRFIADISGLNVILDPAVRGTVTLKLTEVPWDQALDLITRNQGLGYTLEGNVIRVAPLSKLEQEMNARRRLEEEKMLNAPLVTKIIPLSYAKATEMEQIVKRLLTKKGSTIVDRRTNTLIITDIETNMALWDSTFGLL
jgi:type II secretory pathway component HofQ